MKKRNFLCIGLVMQDILLSGLEDLPKNWEQTLLAAQAGMDTGGGAANSARTFGKLGYSVDISGRIGLDSAGEEIVKRFQKDHVDVAGLLRKEGTCTGTAVGLINKEGERCFITVRGGNSQYCEEDLEGIRQRDYDCVHVNGYFQFPSLEASLPKILEEFRRKGSVISFDTSSSDPSGRWFEAIKPVIACIDFFFTNEYQLKMITGMEEAGKGAEFLQKHGVKNVVLKRGAKGCVIFEEGGDETEIPGFRVEAVDTTGAGDSFDAAYMIGVINGWEPVRCGQFANVVAGLNCTSLGAVGGVPDYQSSLRLMDEYYGKNRKVG